MKIVNNAGSRPFVEYFREDKYYRLTVMNSFTVRDALIQLGYKFSCVDRTWFKEILSNPLDYQPLKDEIINLSILGVVAMRGGEMVKVCWNLDLYEPAQ